MSSMRNEPPSGESVQRELHLLLMQSPLITEVLRRASILNLPEWYLAAGCVAQTVWNLKHGFSPEFAIKDCDLVYFDPYGSLESQKHDRDLGGSLFGDLSVPVEVTNEACVHLWYAEEFGYRIQPYQSIEHAINTFPTTATSVGIRYTQSRELVVYAPFGLSDLLSMTVRANRVQITESIYIAKVARWRAVWSGLHILPWAEGVASGGAGGS